MTIRSRRTKPRAGRLDKAGMEALRREVFGRDGYRCQHELERNPTPGFEGFFETVIRCRTPVTWETGHLAHIKSRGSGGWDMAENTYCCCPTHHIHFHERGPSMQKPVPKKERAA